MDKKMITEQHIQENMFYQIRAEVHERNEYRSLLDECLFTLKQLENSRITNNITLNKLTRKIEKTFIKYDI